MIYALCQIPAERFPFAWNRKNGTYWEQKGSDGMKKTVLAMVMVAVVMIFALELGMEKHFIARREATTQTMVPLEEPAALGDPETETPPEVYALFGVDTTEGDAGRSDCILLLSLDGGVLRMCSLARDTLVTIPGENVETKLGHAYAMGGPDKAMETIRQCFGVEVTEYATVNFSQMADIVNLMGGVEMPLTQAEWNYMGLGSPYLGCKRLCGEEALRYCRIRAIDNDDMRTKRQRTLIASMLTSLQETPKCHLPQLLAEGIQMCRTNLSLGELLRLGKAVVAQREPLTVESMALPGDAVTAWGGIRDDGVWYYVYDLDRAADVLQEFFYGSEAQTVGAEA